MSDKQCGCGVGVPSRLSPARRDIGDEATPQLLWRIVTNYQFGSIAPTELEPLANSLRQIGGEIGLGGLVIISEEGFNFTVAHRPTCSSLDGLVAKLVASCRSDSARAPKVTYSHRNPFRRFTVDIRRELITSWPSAPRASAVTRQNDGTYLTPREWEERLTAGGADAPLLVDTRNIYEWRIGSFRDAVCPPIRHFSELPSWLATLDADRGREVLTFCTGGIRCEKALSAFHVAGFKRVKQLAGGILAYLAEFPHSQFLGECFVFDHRVAVTQNLLPSSTYQLCPHCGDPASTPITCTECGTKRKICRSCYDQGNFTDTKLCASRARPKATRRSTKTARATR